MTVFAGRDNAGDRWWVRDDGQWSWGDTPAVAESGVHKVMSAEDAQGEYGPIPDHVQDWDPQVGEDLPPDWDDSKES